MLVAMLAAHQQQVAALATSWMQCGAGSFSVWHQGERLAVWPPKTPVTQPELRAPLMVGDVIQGELRVCGVAGSELQSRLTAEAALFSQWLQVEDEIDSVTNELIETQDQLLALYDLSRSSRSHLSLPETLSSLAREGGRLVKVSAAAALVSHPDGTVTLVQHPPAYVADDWLLSMFRRAQTDDRELSLSRNGTNPAGLPADIQNIFIVPIQIGGSLTAALALINKRDGPFTSPDMKLARAIAEQAGVQIENVQLYQERLAQTRLETEMVLARRVQMHLLPQRPPTAKGLDIYARTLPALEVGGDFYDLLCASDGPCGFVVGDVSGKGISAALIMAMTRTVLRSASRSPNHHNRWPTPAEIISRATQELYDDLTEVSMFATLFLGQYDAESRQLCYANAGHSPVVYCPVGGPARLLEADGPALGVLPMNLSEDQHMRFGPGDLLFVGTDGFNESRNKDGEMYGYERLLRLIEQLADRPAAEIAANLYATIAVFGAGHPQDDDQTLVVVKGVAA